MNNAVIITQANSHGSGGDFKDFLRLTFQRHAAYARAHQFDFWHITGDCHWKTFDVGSWEKIYWIRHALTVGYPYVVWLDADAAIVSGTQDLRDALPPEKYIGACKHDAPWFRPRDIPPHYNVGVTYWRNSDRTREFVDEWIKRKDGDLGRWAEQGFFNQMIEDPQWSDMFHPCEARWNATVNVNMVNDPAVMGWHGVFPWSRRLELMRKMFQDDYFKFRA